MPPHNFRPSMTTAQQAIARALQDRQEVRTLTRTAAKLTTWGTVVGASGMFAHSRPVRTLQVPASEQVWVAVVSGTFAPQFAQGQTRQAPKLGLVNLELARSDTPIEEDLRGLTPRLWTHTSHYGVLRHPMDQRLALATPAIDEPRAGGSADFA